MVDFLLVLMYIAVFATIVITGWSAAKHLSVLDRSQRIMNNIPVSRIAWSTVALFLILMAIGFLVGSSTPMTVNGEEYSRWFWLKASDMFIFTAALLIIIAAVLVGLSMLKGYWRFFKKEFRSPEVNEVQRISQQ